MKIKQIVLATAIVLCTAGLAQAQEKKPKVEEPNSKTQVEQAEKTPTHSRSVEEPAKHEIPSTRNTQEIDPNAATNPKKKHSTQKATRGKK